jgi:2-polyprenyl-3-methyl-5-hydroxy-6-metoxy-1,4-benzoquinol methylase
LPPAKRNHPFPRATAEHSVSATAGDDVAGYILPTMSDQAPTTTAAGSDVPERFDPATMRGELLEAEHLARYRWAAQLAAGRRVLDAGCGTAYGSAILAQAGALEVVGVDLAVDVLDSVRTELPATVTLEPGDVRDLRFPDGMFDLIVCFEVIEHVNDPGGTLDEFRRLLSPDGILALSSPNRDVYPQGNPHHVHEYTPQELYEELSRRFEFARLERQHTWITSGVLDDRRFAAGEDRELGADLQLRKVVVDAVGTELYTLALAGQRELPEPNGVLELAAAVELRKWDALWQEQAAAIAEQSKVLEQQADLLAANEGLFSEHRDLFAAHERLFAEQSALEGQLREEIDQLRAQLMKAESELARLPGLDVQLKELLQVNDEVLALNHNLQQRQVQFDELTALAGRYAVLVQSSSWKLTRPLRRLGALLRSSKG